MTDQPQAEGAEEQTWFQITSITVGWTQTQSLPDYCNVKPSISITAQVGTGDNPGKVADLLMVACKDFVHAHVDEALEERNRPALYSKEQRYALWSTRVAQRKYGIILPDGEEPPIEQLYAWRVIGGLRLKHMQDYAGQQGYEYLFPNLAKALEVLPGLQAEVDRQRSQPLEVAPTSFLEEEPEEEEDWAEEAGGQQEQLDKNAAQIDLLTKRMNARQLEGQPLTREEIKAELEQLADTSDSVDQEEVTSPTPGKIVLSRAMSALDRDRKDAEQEPDITF